MEPFDADDWITDFAVREKLKSLLDEHTNARFIVTGHSLGGEHTDSGLKALVAAAPALRSINLGCCSLLTVDAIDNLADKLGPVLKELYMDECFDLDAQRILCALLKLEQLEVMSVAHNESVDNSFIIKFGLLEVRR